MGAIRQIAIGLAGAIAFAILSVFGSVFLPQSADFIVENLGGVTKREFEAFKRQAEEQLAQAKEAPSADVDVLAALVVRKLESGGKLLRGEQGPPGPAGPQGLMGPAGRAGETGNALTAPTDRDFRETEEYSAILKKIETLEEAARLDRDSKFTPTAVNRPIYVNISKARSINDFDINFVNISKINSTVTVTYQLFNRLSTAREFCLTNNLEIVDGSGVILSNFRSKIAGSTKGPRSCAIRPPSVYVTASHEFDVGHETKSLSYFKFDCGNGCLFEYRDLSFN